MYKPIRVYINKEYQFTTCKYKTCKEAEKDIRNTKHIVVESITRKYITVYDYDKITCRYAKED